MFKRSKNPNYFKFPLGKFVESIGVGVLLFIFIICLLIYAAIHLYLSIRSSAAILPDPSPIASERPITG
ncbi:MAG TPA: hypothetical protein VLG69_03670 [Candidatus Andersenbacteria bacterium]|nr:hypothetical protein [Candidatus Andersenbacteria bacterium]